MKVSIIREFSSLRIEAYLDLYFEEERKRNCDFQKEAECIVYMRDVFFRLPDSFCCVAEEDGIYVSSVRFEQFQDGYLVSALQTMECFRKRGYATECLKTALSAVEKNKPVYSHVSKQNTESLMIHKKLGFRKALDYAKLLDGSVVTNHYTLVLKR